MALPKDKPVKVVTLSITVTDDRVTQSQSGDLVTISVDKTYEDRRRKNNNAKNIRQIMDNVVLQVNCTSLMRRVGGTGDGGKWVCNPSKVNGTVLSFGVGNNVDLETD